MSLIKENKNIVLHPYDPIDRVSWENMRKELSGAMDLSKDILLGGSDVGVIMGLSEYKTRAALYYEHIGMKKVVSAENEHTYRGRALEQTIIDWWWQYFDPIDGDINKLIASQRASKPVRSSKPLHSMVVNKEFKGLFANVDQLIMPDENVLEIKSMYATALDKWESGIPPYQVVQIQTYLMLLEKQEGEVFILVDATFPVMFPFKANEQIQQKIMESVTDYCDRVNSARREMAKLTNPDDAWTVAYEYEPPVEMTPAYIKFLKEMHRPENMVPPLSGDQQLLDHVIDYAKVKRNITNVTADLLPHEIAIRKEFVDNGVNEISFKDYPSIKWDKKLSINYKKFL